jgi:DNA-binding LacI/PurR family transcriptional regulator
MVLSGASGPSAATTERVIAVANRLGYRADRSAALLARKRSRTLGVTLIPSNVFHAEIVEQIQDTADTLGYELVLGSFTHVGDERRAIETLIDFRCEALLLLGPSIAARELAEVVGDIPAVSVGRPLDLPGVDVIRADDHRGMTQLVDYLVSLGHRRIAHADGGPGRIALVRRRAYTTAMGRHGLQSLVLRGGLTERDGAEAATALQPKSGVTAIVAYNDRGAIGVMDHFDRTGLRVPHDISVTGFDDSLMARLARIDLTSVNQAPGEQARLAVEAAVDRLDNGRIRRRETVLPATLVVRSSTGPAPGCDR